MKSSSLVLPIVLVMPSSVRVAILATRAKLQSRTMHTRALILLLCLVTGYPAHAFQCRRHFLPSNQVCPVGDPNDPNGPAAGTFLAKVCDLQTPYDPSNPTSTTGYSSPICAGTASYKSYLSQLAAAFTLAPVDVQQKLCALTHVFVTSSTSLPDAWGIWEIAPAQGSFTQRGNGGVYIAVPGSMLMSATTLAIEENTVYARLFGIASYPPTSPPNLPSFTSASAAANSRAAGTLAILAHELGHILLADANADGTGVTGRMHPRTNNGTALCEQPVSRCFESDFLGTSSESHRWNSNNFHANMRRWVPFGDQHGNNHQRAGINFATLAQDVRSGSSNAVGEMAAVYTSGEFVSVFATVSPEEDFIETYKYKVLAAAKDPATLIPLDLTFTNQGDVLQAVRNPAPDLARKIGCVSVLVP
jgi:hypothetical protein